MTTACCARPSFRRWCAWRGASCGSPVWPRPDPAPMRETSLIVTADDFGMSIPVNEAVEEAHRKGVLTCASLVVAGEAAADAVRRAKRMPGLGVGLHLALLDAPSALSRNEIPDLLDPN